MTPENQLIPYHTSELPPGPWLIFAPHPDDETFGMGGSMLLANNAGIEVDVVILTDGGQDFDTQEDNIVDVREKEALNACAKLGVRDCQFWRQPDRGLSASEDLKQRVSQLIEKRKPARIFVPSFLEFHPDHRATAQLVWESVQTMPNCDAVIVAYDITNLGPCNLLIDISTVIKEKQAVMQLYASQVDSHRYIELVQSINTARTFSLGNTCEAAEGFYCMHRLPGMPYPQAMQAWCGKFLYSTPLDQPLVSVLVRTKDRPNLLQQALASLALQSYQQLEVVVVNDGGSLVTPVLAGYSTTFTALKTIQNNNPKGRAAAANQAMEQASGAYFLFLDDDDWLDSQHIAKLVLAHQQDPNTIAAYTGARAVDPEADQQHVMRLFDEPFDRHRLYYENYIPIHTVLVKRSVIDGGYRMDESLEVFEDWDFWLQLCQLTETFKYVPGVSANYRIDSQSGVGVKGGFDDVRRRLYARWSKTWGISEIDDLLTRLAIHGKPSS